MPTVRFHAALYSSVCLLQRSSGVSALAAGADMDGSICSMLVPATTAETARTAHNFLVASIRVYFRFWISRRTVETPLLRREPIIIMTINSAKYTQNDEYVAAHIPNFVIFRHTYISPANPIKPQINPCIRSFFIVRSFLDSERGTVGHNDCNSLLCFHSYTHNTPYFHQGGFRTLSH